MLKKLCHIIFIVYVIFIGSFGGNLNVTVAGSGFVSSVIVKVCDREAVVSDVTSSSLTFLTPDFSDG